jgi:hypothetical protein
MLERLPVVLALVQECADFDWPGTGANSLLGNDTEYPIPPMTVCTEVRRSLAASFAHRRFFLASPASLIAIATACFGFVTIRPLPECSVPRPNSDMTVLTLLFLADRLVRFFTRRTAAGRFFARFRDLLGICSPSLGNRQIGY